MSKPRNPEVGDAVIYFDQYRREHHALLEVVHGDVSGGPVEGQPNQGWNTPCVNVLYLSHEPEKIDDHGRQKLRESSNCHASSQHPLVGNYWCFPEERDQCLPDYQLKDTKR